MRSSVACETNSSGFLLVEPSDNNESHTKCGKSVLKHDIEVPHIVEGVLMTPQIPASRNLVRSIIKVAMRMNFAAEYRSGHTTGLTRQIVSWS